MGGLGDIPSMPKVTGISRTVNHGNVMFVVLSGTASSTETVRSPRRLWVAFAPSPTAQSALVNLIMRQLRAAAGTAMSKLGRMVRCQSTKLLVTSSDQPWS